MSCRRVSRELLERFRFGEELDERSEPHLLHLEQCPTCREEVGIDRALVSHLRRALRLRVEGHAPSERAWENVRQRALATDASPRGLRRLFGRVSAGVSAAGAVAAIAFVVTLGTSGDRGAEQIADFRLQAIGRGETARANAMPTDPPPLAVQKPFFGRPAPAPAPAGGRFSVVIKYGDAGEPIATVRPGPAPISGRLR